MNPEEIEQTLQEQFQATLENYYRWEEETKEKFLSTIYPETEEEV